MESESTICACGHGREYHDLPSDWIGNVGNVGWGCSFQECSCDDWNPEPAPAEPAP